MDDDSTQPPRPLLPGQPGNPGRPKGIVNKRTIKAQELADQMGVDPLAVLLWYAGDQYAALHPGEPERDINGRLLHVPLDLRLQAAKEAVKYLYPSLKAIEVTGKDGGPLEAYMSMPERVRQERLKEMAARVLGSDAAG